MTEAARQDPTVFSEQAAVDGLLRAARRPSVADAVMQRLPPGPPPRPGTRGRWIMISLGAVLGLVGAAWYGYHQFGSQASRTSQSPEQSISIIAVADAAVDEANPSMSSGTGSQLRACGAAKNQGIVYVRFHVPRRTSTHATLVLDSISGSGPVSVHPVDAQAIGSWSEADVRWWHRPAFGPALGKLKRDGNRWRLEIDCQAVPMVELALLSDSEQPILFFSREMEGRGPRLELRHDASAESTPASDF